MSNLKIYQKPMLKNVKIQSNSAVADWCWSEPEHGSPVHYYDTEGHGFVKFRVFTPDCSAWDGRLNTRSYTCSRVEDGTYTQASECPDWSQALENAALAEFQVAFDEYFATVSNHGSSAKGFSDTFPKDHDDMS